MQSVDVAAAARQLRARPRSFQQAAAVAATITQRGRLPALKAAGETWLRASRKRSDLEMRTLWRLEVWGWGESKVGELQTLKLSWEWRSFRVATGGSSDVTHTAHINYTQVMSHGGHRWYLCPMGQPCTLEQLGPTPLEAIGQPGLWRRSAGLEVASCHLHIRPQWEPLDHGSPGGRNVVAVVASAPCALLPQLCKSRRWTVAGRRDTDISVCWAQHFDHRPNKGKDYWACRLVGPAGQRLVVVLQSPLPHN
jgi:hypothetical protein